MSVRSFSFIVTTIMILAVCRPAQAQQASAHGVAGQMNIMRLENRLKVLEADNARAGACQTQGKIYAPGNDRADEEGCMAVTATNKCYVPASGWYDEGEVVTTSTVCAAICQMCDTRAFGYYRTQTSVCTNGPRGAHVVSSASTGQSCTVRCQRNVGNCGGHGPSGY